MPPEPALVRDAVDTEPGANKPAVSVTPTPLLRTLYPPTPRPTPLSKPLSGATDIPSRRAIRSGGSMRGAMLSQSAFSGSSSSSMTSWGTQGNFRRVKDDFIGARPPPPPPPPPPGQTLGPPGSLGSVISCDVSQ